MLNQLGELRDCACLNKALETLNRAVLSEEREAPDDVIHYLVILCAHQCSNKRRYTASNKLEGRSYSTFHEVRKTPADVPYGRTLVCCSVKGFSHWTYHLVGKDKIT